MTTEEAQESPETGAPAPSEGWWGLPSWVWGIAGSIALAVVAAALCTLLLSNRVIMTILFG